jgi:alpha-N-acetylglucosaminidase
MKRLLAYQLLTAMALQSFAVESTPKPDDADFPKPTPCARHEEKVAAVKAGDYDLVLIGDSITHTLQGFGGKYAPLDAVWNKYYAPRRALNLGYSGYRTENILWNLRNGELDFKKSPKLFMILLGTNNADSQHFSGMHTPEDICAGIKAIVELIHARHPISKILLLRPFPKGLHDQKSEATSPPLFSFSREEVETARRAGELMAKLADDKQVFSLDVGSAFLRPDGRINVDLMPDLQHPNAAGAEAWAKAVEPMLDKLMGDRPAASPDGVMSAARGVLERVAAGAARTIRMETIPAEGSRDVYEYESKDGVLRVRGSSAVALCRGFYDYARAVGLGQVSWAEGRHLRIPERWPDAPAVRLVTPFEIRHAYNVVTAGYTFPYWTWERWERELDWQAMHGFNMLMAPTATEAVMERVWLKIGLTRQEVDDDTCGPAHQPWYRMGNICGIDGPLPEAWHADQVALQHRILARMRELGMEPVVQSFAGFVPRGFSRIHPETRLHNTCWNGRLPARNRPVLMLPNDPQFAVITKAFMDEWKKEFGAARYFLVDSFNEMAIPKTDRPETELLADYGEKTWQSIRAANPEACWAIQGWTFGYQNWKPENLEALLSKVPDDRMLVLDYANDYFPVWKKYKAFYGKTWACGYVPNMGGKTALTGNLSLYATGSAQVLKAPDHGNLKGFTISGEGLENNEAIYELLADMAWSSDAIDLDSWFERYSINRYGACPPAVAESWKILRQGCYGGLRDHPGFGWQHFGGLDRNPNFHAATERLLSAAGELRGSPLYRADAVERTALSLSLKADEWIACARNAFGAGDDAAFEKAAARSLELLTQIDRLMECHPYHRLERWIDFARAHGDTPELKRLYESNARCIVTYWADGVQNYSCRVWGGLVRDYYREWLRREFDAMKTGAAFDAQAFMIEYTRGTGTSSFVACSDPVADAKSWFSQAMAETLPDIVKPAPIPGDAEPVGQWTSAQIGTDWKTVEWPFPSDKLAKLVGVHFAYASGNHRLEVQSVEIVADGKTVASDKHYGYAGAPNLRNSYRLAVPAGTTGNNGCTIRAIVKGGGGTDSRGTVAVLVGK